MDILPKHKRKIVSVGKVVNGNKAGWFQRKGEFRLPFSRREEEAMVLFFMDKGGFKLRRGNRVWQHMEYSGICPGRT